MPKTMKQRIYTYDQLDAILCRRGEADQHGFVRARLYSTMHVVAHRQPYLRLVRGSTAGRIGYPLAYIWRAAGGDTVYGVSEPSIDMRRSPKGRAMYRKDCKRFTPRELSGPLPKSMAWYRIHDGVARPITVAATVREGPINSSLLLPRSTRPSYAEWTQPHVAHHPKLCNRAKAFFTRLRRELKDGPACTVQLIRSVERPGLFHPTGLHMQVVMAATERARSPRLLISVCNHDKYSRTRFHIDGDFAVRHAYVIGKDAGKDELQWRSTRDAIVGIKEWVMANIYIPGF